MIVFTSEVADCRNYEANICWGGTKHLVFCN